MGLIEKKLVAGEKILYRAKLHPVIFFWPVFFILAGTVFVFSAIAAESGNAGKWFFGILLVVTGSIWTRLVFVRYLKSEYGITDRKVVFENMGLMVNTGVEIPYQNLKSFEVKQNIIGKKLDYGTLAVTLDDGQVEKFKTVEAPLRLEKALKEFLTIKK